MVTNMGNMFSGCSKLTSLDVSGWDTSSVAGMDNMFYNCSNLTSLDVSGWDTSSVTSMQSMFEYCSKLTSLKWTNWMITVSLSSTKLTSECVKDLVKNLGRVDSEQTLTLNKTMARYLDKLDMIHATAKGWVITPDVVGIKYANVTSSTDLSSVSDTTYKICIIELTESNKYTRLNDAVAAYTACNEVYIYDDGSVTSLSDLLNTNNATAKTKITAFGFIDGYFNNNTSTDHMFQNCTSLTSLDVSSFNTSRVTNMSGMFASCSSLTSLDVTSFNTSMVTDMSGMFYGCSKLTSLDLSHFDTSNVTAMFNMFQYCSSLTSLDVSGWDTSMVTSMGGMFYNCLSLTSLDVSGWDTSRVTGMDNMFYNCSSLTRLDVSNWNTPKLVAMDYIFSGCSKLISLDLRGFDTSKAPRLWGPFNACYSLSSIKWTNWTRTTGLNDTVLTSECLKDLIKNLARVVSEESLTLNRTQLGYLTEEDIATATNKGWTLGVFEG